MRNIRCTTFDISNLRNLPGLVLYLSVYPRVDSRRYYTLQVISSNTAGPQPDKTIDGSHVRLWLTWVWGNCVQNNASSYT